MMHTLAKIGFHQSYTYFTWRNTARELIDYLRELSGPAAAYMRPNFFVNTPDILHEYLQHGGPPAFEARLVLASTLSPTYGIYSGFESFENVPVREGSEEYLDSEKYEIKRRSLDGPLLPLVTTINRIRRENPALQRLGNIAFLETENEQLFGYMKREEGNDIIVVVNLDPAETQRGVCIVPVATGLPPAYPVRDLLADTEWTWHIGRNFVELAPGKSHVLKVGK
jgi:starch synthase (maltosyl-transferring)